MTQQESAAAPTGPLVAEGLSGRRVARVLQVYDEVRTAHLERVAGARTTILYRQRRYDFDEELGARIDVRQAGTVRTLLWALQHAVDVIEIAEPFVVGAAPRSLAAIVGNRIRVAARGGRRARVVSYGLENLHPDEVAPQLPRRTRVKRLAQTMLMSMVWRSIDRFALGTDVAMSTYQRSFNARWPEHRVIPALPVARRSAMRVADRGPTLVFLGDLSARKGFPQVLEIWPQVKASLPAARLMILGRGVGVPEATRLAERDPAVTMLVNPQREVIFETLASSKVLVLPSQRTPFWREQVGLPIVEGLSLGCGIVTTSETGIAPWLAAHGHEVVSPGDTEALCAAVVAALKDERTPDDIIAHLPEVDGRAAAEAWLCEMVQ